MVLHIVGLIRSLPPAEQAEIRKALSDLQPEASHGEPWTEADADESAQIAFAALDERSPMPKKDQC
jgi:hypothetical protein